MKIAYDNNKNAVNIYKHDVSLADAKRIDWDSCLVWTDDRKAYGEARQCGLAAIDERIYYVAFVDRDDVRRIISLRKANLREVKYYVEQT
ncbi:MAG: BrnT family toxin [Collimonas sp.]